MNNYPYTNTHELNLDWILQVVKKFEEDYGGISEALSNAIDAIENAGDETAEAINTLKTAVLSDIQSAYADAIADIPANYAAVLAAIAPSFDPTVYFKKGEYAWYNGALKVFTKNHPVGSWIGTDVAPATIGIDVAHLKRDLIELNNKYALMDFVGLVGVEKNTRLQNNGTTVADVVYVTTDFIPVVAGDRYLMQHPGYANTYSCYRCVYDSNKNFITGGYATFNAQEPEQIYDVPTGAGIAFVRFSISPFAYNSGFRFVKAENTIDDLVKVDKYTDYEIAHVDQSIKCVDFVKKYGMVHGYLKWDDGTIEHNDDYYTIGDYIPVSSGDALIISISTGNNFTLFRAFYDKDKNYHSGTYFTVEGGIRRYSVLPGVAYVKYCVYKTVYENNDIQIYIENDITSGNLHLLNLPNSNTFHKYTGSEPPLAMNKGLLCSKIIAFNDTTEPAGKYQQGIAIYNNLLFQFMSDDFCRIFDIANRGALVNEFSLTCGHGNTACFSDEFYDSGDDFPLCYISDINGKVYVTRISTTGATLIKTLYFNPATYGTAPQFALDLANNIGYTVANKTDTVTMPTAVICKFDMTSQTQNGDGTYTPAFIERFELSMVGDYPVLQGVKFLNGYLFLASGAASDLYNAFITIVDIANRAIYSRIEDFPAAVAKKELEDLDFLPNLYSAKYDMVLHFRQNGYYKMSI